MKDLDNIPTIFTPAMLSKFLMLSRNTTYDLLRSGKIQSVKIGRQYRITAQAVKDYLLKT